MSKKEQIAMAVAACKTRGGKVTPEKVLEAARDEDNILHGEFNWNVEEAAHDAWLARARELIRQSKAYIVYGERELIYPVYVSDPRTTPATYIETRILARHADAKMQALEAELERIRAAIKRAMSIAVVFGVDVQFRRMLDEVVNIEALLETEDA